MKLFFSNTALGKSHHVSIEKQICAKLGNAPKPIFASLRRVTQHRPHFVLQRENREDYIAKLERDLASLPPEEQEEDENDEERSVQVCS